MKKTNHQEAFPVPAVVVNTSKTMIRLNFSAPSNIQKKMTEIDEIENEEDSLDEDLEDD
jgi:hypothetical protein